MKTRISLFLAFALFCLSANLPLPKSHAMQSAASANSPADLVLTNGRIWLGADASSFAEALAVRRGEIVRVGAAAEIGQLIDGRTQVIDLGGKLAVPGFNDAHIHFLSGALGLTEVDLTGTTNVAEMVNRIAAYAQRNPAAEWITGRGWEYGPFPGGMPTKVYLDAVVKDRPIFLRAYDGHSGWANSKALQLAGITRDTKFDGFGEIVRDSSGEPSGALKEGAQALVSRLIPEPARERKLDALRRGMKLAASLGITSIQNASGSPDEFSLYEELWKRDELSLRVSMAFSIGAKTTPQQIEELSALKRRNDQSPQSQVMLRAGSVKFVLDGVIESHTAAMLERYSDLPPEHGAPLGDLTMLPESYQDLVARLDKGGFQIYTHAIGDRAVREALNAYEKAQNANRRMNARYRVEHIETVAPEDIPRFARLGVMASMEPIHADPASADVWSKAVGADRLKYAFAWQSLLKSGARLVFSSDWPASISLDPIRGLHCAVNRRTTDGLPPRGWVPEQRISLIDALRAYTQAGAYSSFEEGIKGRIAPGMLADVVVLSQDLFKINPMRIHETRVLLTVFDGKVIYQDGMKF
jgi:predicted amidohydrolase YtcJ